YRPQEAIALAIAVLMAMALRCWKTLPIALVALALNVWQAAPVYRDHPAASLVAALSRNVGRFAPVYRDHHPAPVGPARLTIAHINLQSSRGNVGEMKRGLAAGAAGHAGGRRHPQGHLTT